MTGSWFGYLENHW